MQLTPQQIIIVKTISIMFGITVFLLTLIAINNFIKIFAFRKAENKFVEFLKNDAYYQFHSKVRPAGFNFQRYHKLFSDMLDRNRELEEHEFNLIRSAINQSSIQECINYMSHLWFRSKINENFSLSWIIYFILRRIVMKKIILVLLVLFLLTGCGLSGEMCRNKVEDVFSPESYVIVRIHNFSWIVRDKKSGKCFYIVTKGLFKSGITTIKRIPDLCKEESCLACTSDESN